MTIPESQDALGNLERKLDHLRTGLAGRSSLLVAYSGGTDSSLLASVAFEQLAGRMLAVTLDSPFLSAEELETARQLSREKGFPHRVISWDPLADPALRANPPDRCYLCKKTIVARLNTLARDEGYETVAEGSQLDDASDTRPGARAVREGGWISPLAEAGMTKRDVRRAAALLGLHNAGRPASACLASRVPSGVPLDGRLLARIEQAEAVLRRLGFDRVRVRSDGATARLEVDPERVADLVTDRIREQVCRELHALDFRHVAVDLDGYRRGGA